MINLKHKYIAEIYKSALKKVPIRKIHKNLYDLTINSKVQSRVLFNFAVKLADRTVKRTQTTESGLLPMVLFTLLTKNKISEAANKIINKEVGEKAEKEKLDTVDNEIKNNRIIGRWFYLASSHGDCAKDHKPYQGKMYFDNKAPLEIRKYATDMGYQTIQWVMDKPAWFITRPNCRHYFVGLDASEVIGKGINKLKRKYKTHTKEGNRDLQTPKTAAIREYTERLSELNELYRIHPSQELLNAITKTKMLLDKWMNK